MKVYECLFPYCIMFNFAQDSDDYIKLASKFENGCVDDADIIINEMCSWCESNLKNNWEYEFNEETMADIFRFRTENHRTMFLLKWSS